MDRIFIHAPHTEYFFETRKTGHLGKSSKDFESTGHRGPKVQEQDMTLITSISASAGVRSGIEQRMAGMTSKNEDKLRSTDVTIKVTSGLATNPNYT